MDTSSPRKLLSAIRRALRNRFPLCYGMRGTAPINPAFGSAEGTPVDRFYIERFLDRERARITGTVLEIGDRGYTERFGSGVTRSDVLSAAAGDGVTYVGDLASCPEIPSDSYDCVVLTQTLHYLRDMSAGVSELARILKPGGSVLCTVPGISQVSRFDMDRWGDRWRLTSLSAEELFSERFAPEDVSVDTYGNALASVCFLQGVPAERVSHVKLDRREPDYQLIVAVVATKATDA